MRIVASSNRRAVAALLSPQRLRDAATDSRVAEIVNDVRRRGDRALKAYARELDGWSGPLEIGTDAMREAAATIPASVRSAIRLAARNIRTVAKRQVPRAWRVRTMPGVTVEGRVIPLDRVGCYVPGGKYPLLASAHMSVLTAKVAGCPRVITCAPPFNGRPAPAIVAAQAMAGADEIYVLGGIQAIGEEDILQQDFG